MAVDDESDQDQELAFEEESVSTADVPLFTGEERLNTLFAGVQTALNNDSNSIYKRLVTAFKTPGAKIVVVGAGGAGKTETILRAMEDESLTKASFDLRGWYLEKAGIDKKAYLKGYNGATGFSQIKADQLAALKADKETIKADIKGKAADVLFLDEIDLGMGKLNGEELEAMQLLLEWSDAVAPKKSKVIVLHPLVSTQTAVRDLLSSKGYPTMGSPKWIDFSDPYSSSVEDSIISALLELSSGSATEKAAAADAIKTYIGGDPGAYMPFLVNKAGALDALTGKTCVEAATSIKEGAKAKVGGKLIKINVGIQASPESRTFITDLLMAGGSKNESSVTSSPDVDGAVACMVVMHRGGVYYVPQVVKDALAEYCIEGNAKTKKKIAPICDNNKVGEVAWSH